MVASMPTFAVVGTTPGGVGARLGSSGLPRACVDHHVAVALDPGRDRPLDLGGIEYVDVVVDDDDVHQVHHGQRGKQGVLALARLLADRDHRVPEGASAQRDVDVLDLDSRGLERPPDRLVAGGRGKPGVFPWHVQCVVDRVLAHEDRLDAHVRIPVQPAHQAGELAEAALGLRPARREDLRLEHDLGVRDIGQVDRLAGGKLDRSAPDTAGDRHLVHADRCAIAGAHDLHRMRADGDGDRTGPPGLVGAVGEEPHVVRRDDVDSGEVALLHHEAIDAAIHAVFRVARDHHPRSDHRAAVVDRGHRHRQAEEVHLVASLDRFLRGRGGDAFRRDRMVDALLELRLDLAIVRAAHRQDGAAARADEARDHRHVVADDVVEEERLVGLVDERRDMPDVDRLPQVDELAPGAQPLDEAAESLGEGPCFQRSRIVGFHFLS